MNVCRKSLSPPSFVGYVFSVAAVFVAQTASLLYRRMSSCRTAPWPERLDSANALPIGNRRHSRLTICATLNTFFVEGRDHSELFARNALLNPPPAPPRRGATPAGHFPSWEGSGVGCFPE